jgi:hypothetical protein
MSLHIVQARARIEKDFMYPLWVRETEILEKE